METTAQIDTVTGEPTPQKSTNGAASVIQKDINNNTIGGAYCPSDSGQVDLTGSAAQQIQALPAGAYYVRFDVITAAVNIKFGTAASLASTPVTATSGTRIQSGQSLIVAVPVGATSFGYIGNNAAVNWTVA